MSEEKPKPPAADNPVPASQHPVIKAARRHHDSASLRCFTIPEWVDEDDNPIEIYFWPWTLEDQDFYERHADPDKEGIKAFADVFMRKALDADGGKLFSIGHRSQLIRNVDPSVLIAACRVIMNHRPKEYFLKNFSATADAG